MYNTGLAEELFEETVAKNYSRSMYTIAQTMSQITIIQDRIP
jgi:hypothetical protein